MSSQLNKLHYFFHYLNYPTGNDQAFSIALHFTVALAPAYTFLWLKSLVHHVNLENLDLASYLFQVKIKSTRFFGVSVKHKSH